LPPLSDDNLRFLVARRRRIAMTISDSPVAVTFDDVLLVPGYSEVLPADADVTTAIAPGFALGAPLISAAMDTVTEAAMAIAMAQLGGLGVIHKNLDAEKQSAEIARVKRSESGVVTNPVCVSPDMTVADALALKEKHGFSGLPVVGKNGAVAGIVTNRDLRFEDNMALPVSKVMTPRDKLVVVRADVSPAAARRLMREHRIERVVVVDKQDRLTGLLTVKDLIKAAAYPSACKDADGRLRVAAAVGASDTKRADALVEAGADALVVDTAHGHSRNVVRAIAGLKKRHPKIAVIGGNIATGDAARALADAGADAVKVGVGPGSICTTRIVAGVGVPQISAIENVADAISRRRRRIGIIADGGIRYSGDIAKAIAAGANAVMIGGLLAGAEESPGDIELFQGRAYKNYRGMGSIGAMTSGGGERYFRSETDPAKMVPEGVEGRVPYKGRAQDVVEQLLGGLRAAMGYAGCKNISRLRRAKWVKITAAGARESHVHDVQITREAPNYQVD
jgi:IMP dehydrogenase